MTIKNGMTDKDASIASAVEPPADPKTSQILGEIAQTRSDMSGTLGELQERLTPGAIKEKAREKLDDAKQAIKSEAIEAKDAVRDAAREKVGAAVETVQDTVSEGGRSVLQFVRANPIPVALTGIGLTWFLFGARRDRGARYRPYDELDPYDAEDYYASGPDTGGMRSRSRRAAQRAKRGMAEVTQTVQGKAESLADNAGQLAHRAQDSARTVARRAGDRADRLADDVRYRAARTGDRAREIYRDNPLVVGAALAVAGTALGLAIPLTQREQDLLGGASEELVREAQGMARGALDKVQGATKHVGGDGE